jgi:hypothetical protein
MASAAPHDGPQQEVGFIPQVVLFSIVCIPSATKAAAAYDRFYGMAEARALHRIEFFRSL